MVVYTLDINSKNAVIFLLTRDDRFTIDGKSIFYGNCIGFGCFGFGSKDITDSCINSNNDHRAFLCQIFICGTLLFEPISIGCTTNQKSTFVMLYFLWQAV